jgi:hypothetical protein
MGTTEPARASRQSAPFEITGAYDNWQLAVALLATQRRPGEAGPHAAAAQRLAKIAAEGGVAAVEQAALGLTTLAGMLLELYADLAGESADEVLEEAAALLSDRTVWD